MSESVISAYDSALFDLDGVVYLGPEPVPGAVEGLSDLRKRGTKIGFVTNSAARAPAAVAEKLREFGIICDEDDVVTSARAAARLLADRFPNGGLVLVVGTDALRDEVRAFGFDITASAADRPMAVIQGGDPNLTWGSLAEAAIAVQNGAVWIVTNIDTTRPTGRGLVPGAGTAVAAVGTCSPCPPLVAGKPQPPLMVETLRRIGGTRAIFVGDRIDTDIAGAAASGMDSMLVLSGSHGVAELLTAAHGSRPTHLGKDVRDLLAPRRVVQTDYDTVRCGAGTARRSGRGFEVTGEDVDACWALAHLVWSILDAGEDLDVGAAVAALSHRSRTSSRADGSLAEKELVAG